ncbi:hypothetical protein ACLESD_14620 [Pyxidicoccus sp. 3LFB2]
MRRFFVMMSLVALSACGGQPPAAEETPVEQTPATEESGTGAQSAGPTCTSGNAWECFCGQFRTYDTCRPNRSCVWAYNRCSPTYE